MTQLLSQLSASGYKVTPQRRLILEVIQESKRHLTTDEITALVREKQPSVSAATIYRNLNILVDIGLLSRLNIHDGPARYELNQGHNHHMVCLTCGNAIKLGMCPMQGEVLQIIKANGFKVSGHHFEITGYCKACQLKQEREKGDNE